MAFPLLIISQTLPDCRVVWLVSLVTSAMMTEVSAGSSLTEELVRQEGADTDLTRVLMAIQNIIKIIR